jgi:hypothetical protein
MTQTLSTRWRQFIEERLLAFDPTLDVGSGSPAYTQVIEPLLRVLSPDLVESDLQTFLLTRLRQAYTELDFSSASALGDILVKPSRVIIEPVRRETRAVRNRLTLQYPEALLSEDADDLLKNLFFERDQGSYATVSVRIWFRSPIDVVIGSANVAYTASGLRFVPTRAQRISAAAMLMNTDGDLYYFDVSYRAERQGTAYNVAAGDVIGVRGLPAARRATNRVKASAGDESETTTAFVDRAQASIGEQSLNTITGLTGALSRDFDALRLLQVVGFNDAEMQRDLISGGGLGAVVTSDAGAMDGSTSDDGDGDGYTPYFDQGGSADFTVVFGPVGTDLTGYCLTMETPTGPVDFWLGSVVGATRVRISTTLEGTDRLPEPLAGMSWHIRQRTLALSDIPGGILFPDVPGGTELSVPPDQIHVGGCTDIHVRGSSVDLLTVALPLVSDEEYLFLGEDARTTLVDPDVVTLQDLPATVWALVTEGRTSLYIEEGTNQGAYRVVEKMSGGPPYQVRLGQNMTALATGLSYLVVDDLDINLVNPREMRYLGDDLRTVAGTAVVDTLSGLPDFGTVGVVDTDYVRILNGDDAGEYGIAAGGVAGNQLTLQTVIPHTASPLRYEVYRKIDGIDLPLLRVSQVELLNSSLAPTGSYIPYRHPIDIRSFSFQNPGNESKAGTTVDVTLDTLTRGAPPDEDVVTSSLGILSLDYWALGVRPGDLVNILTSDNQGFYAVTEVGGDPASALNSNQLRLDRDLPWAAAGMEYLCGAPSYGSFRLYFLEPVTIWMTSEQALFSVDLGAETLRFRPSPTVWYQYLPTPITVPTVTLTPGSGLVVPYSPAGVNIDAKIHELAVGDRVEISYAPIVGSLNLVAAGALNLDGLSIKVDVGYGEETVVFSGTSLGVDVIVSQINQEIGYPAAAKHVTGPGTGFLMLRADRAITLLDNSAAGVLDCTATIFGVNRQTYNPWLAGPFAGVDTPNDSPEKGQYLVSALAAFPTGALTLTELDGTPWVADPLGLWGGPVTSLRGHYARVSRQGLQRSSSTAMLDRGQDDLGLYYWDVECVSEGHGNTYNIAPEYQATLAGYESEGWALRTADETLSYSMDEEPWLDVSPRFLVAGADDDQTQKEELAGQSIQVRYEQDPIVEQVHDYVRAIQRRVTCHSPLVRALFPTFVRTSTIEYRGGDVETTVRTALIPLIEITRPGEQLELSTLITRITQSGATKITYPITLFAVTHLADRSIWSERSEDSVSTGRLNALLADATADGLTSYIALLRIL